MSDQAAENAIFSLLGKRSEGETICPSEAARLLAGDDDWRGEMERVHATVDHLVSEGEVVLSWKGEPLTVRSGPYRIALEGSEQT